MKVSLIDNLQLLKGVNRIESIRPKDNGIQSGDEVSAPMSFSEMLSKQLNEVNAQGVEAERSIERSIMGKETNPHTTMIAVQKATMSLTLMMSIKERLERAYQELIRTPLG